VSYVTLAGTMPGKLGVNSRYYYYYYYYYHHHHHHPFWLNHRFPSWFILLELLHQESNNSIAPYLWYYSQSLCSLKLHRIRTININFSLPEGRW